MPRAGRTALRCGAVVASGGLGELSSMGMQARKIRRNGENVVAGAEFGQGLGEQIVQLLRGEVGVDAAHGAIKAHAGMFALRRR